MKKPNVISLDDLFGTDGTEDEKKVNDTRQGATELDISKLVSFKNHPFKLYEGQRLDDMVESIKEHGIITPIIVRKLDNGQHEILSGHNRVNAAKIAGLNNAPVVIKENLTDEEAMLIVTETNVIQRSFWELSHSEKARVIAERHNAIKNQGRRIDLINEIEMLSNIDGYEENSTSVQFEQKLESREKVAKSYNLSPSAIARLLRIDMLINSLKTKIDNEEIPLTAGVNLSFLTQDQQESVESIIKDNGFKVNIEKSEQLKNLAQNKSFTDRKAYEILSDTLSGKPKKNKKPKFTAKFTKTIIDKYVTANRSLDEVEKKTLDLLEEYYSQNHEQESEDELEV